MADSDSTAVAAGARHSWFKFYPSDWKGDELLAMCSLGARGLLIDLLCLMHRAVPYGYLLVNGKIPSDAELARLVRASSVSELRRLRSELLDRGVLSTEGRKVYSRRMVRKAKQSAIGRETGARGGNPALRGVNGTPLTGTLKGQPTQPLTGGDNTQKLEARTQTPKPPSVLTSDELGDKAQDFIARCREVYPRVRSGAQMRIREARDFPTALELVATYPDVERLGAMLEVFLLMKPDACRGMNVPGTINQFAVYATECDRLLRVNGR